MIREKKLWTFLSIYNKLARLHKSSLAEDNKNSSYTTANIGDFVSQE